MIVHPIPAIAEMQILSRSRQGTAQSAKSRSVGAAFLAAFLGFAGAAALIFAASSVAVLAFAFIVLPFASWCFFLREARTALLFTMIAELYSVSSGTWLTVGALSIRWMLILGTVAAFIVVDIVKWTPGGSREGKKRPPYTVLVLWFGATFPLLLFGSTAAFTNNPLNGAAKSLGFLLALLLYFPLRRCFLKHSNEVVGLLIGQSFPLGISLLLMSIGPGAYRQTVTQGLLGNLEIGTTETGIARAVPVHIVLMLFPACMAMVMMTIEGSKLRRTALALAAMVSLVPLIVTFIAGPILAFFLTVIEFGLLMFTTPKTRGQGVMMMSGAAGFLLIVIGIAAVLTPELLQQKLLTRLSGIAVGNTSIDSRRDLQWSVANDDLTTHLWFGRGAGATMPDPLGGEDPNVEMEGLLIFHRYGALGSAVLLGGLLAFALHPFVWLRKGVANLASKPTTLAFWATGVAIIQCGMWDPYFSTPYTALFIALYLSSIECQFAVAEKRDRRGDQHPSTSNAFQIVPASQCRIGEAH